MRRLFHRTIAMGGVMQDGHKSPSFYVDVSVWLSTDPRHGDTFQQMEAIDKQLDALAKRHGSGRFSSSGFGGRARDRSYSFRTKEAAEEFAREVRRWSGSGGGKRTRIHLTLFDYTKQVEVEMTR